MKKSPDRIPENKMKPNRNQEIGVFLQKKSSKNTRIDPENPTRFLHILIAEFLK